MWPLTYVKHSNGKKMHTLGSKPLQPANVTVRRLTRRCGSIPTVAVDFRPSQQVWGRRLRGRIMGGGSEGVDDGGRSKSVIPTVTSTQHDASIQ